MSTIAIQTLLKQNTEKR